MADNITWRLKIVVAKNMTEFLKNHHILYCQESKILVAKNNGG